MARPRTILHVDMDAFFASIEQRDRPELRGRPVAVGAAHNQRGVVAAASYEARRFGIHSAMPSRTAYRLCPQTVFVPPDHDKYCRESERVMEILSHFTPLTEPVSVDEAYLDVTASFQLHGSGAQIGRQIREQIKAATQLTASVGIAPNKFLAKLASDFCKPDGLKEILESEKVPFLRPLPIGRIPGIGKKTEPVFHELGIHTLADLQDYPLESLLPRFGDWAIHLKACAVGDDDRPVETFSEVKSISNETTFDQDVRDLATLERTLQELSEEVGRRLREQQFMARTVQLKLRWDDFTTLTRCITLSSPTDDTVAISRIAIQLLVRELSHSRPVRLLGLGAQNLVRAPEQLDLFDGESRRRARLNQSADEVRTKFGAAKLKRGVEL